MEEQKARYTTQSVRVNYQNREFSCHIGDSTFSVRDKEHYFTKTFYSNILSARVLPFGLIIVVTSERKDIAKYVIDMSAVGNPLKGYATTEAAISYVTTDKRWWEDYGRDALHQRLVSDPYHGANIHD